MSDPANGQSLTGQCLCGEITFQMDPPFRDVLICHCTQCAQWTGSQVAATGVALDRFTITSGDPSLKWHRSSDTAERGFCSTCGSSLFWRPDGKDHISVMAGTLDDSTAQLKVAAHWYIADQRPYMATCNAAPKFDTDTPGPQS